MSDEQPKRQKFKHTRELIKIALDDGMTQEEIGRLCRVPQSTVSAWKNGKSKATAQQLEPLLSRYGARLRRSTARIYYLGEVVDVHGVPQAAPPRIRVVEGSVVFRHVFTRPVLRIPRRHAELAHEPFGRWLVHQQPGPLFVLVRQQRRPLSIKERTREQQFLEATLNDLQKTSFSGHDELLEVAVKSIKIQRWVETSDDAARWESTVEVGRSLTELLAWVDSEDFELPHERTTVRFLLRKALLEHGHAVPGVEQGPLAQ